VPAQLVEQLAGHVVPHPFVEAAVAQAGHELSQQLPLAQLVEQLAGHVVPHAFVEPVVAQAGHELSQQLPLAVHSMLAPQLVAVHTQPLPFCAQMGVVPLHALAQQTFCRQWCELHCASLVQLLPFAKSAGTARSATTARSAGTVRSATTARSRVIAKSPPRARSTSIAASTVPGSPSPTPRSESSPKAICTAAQPGGSKNAGRLAVDTTVPCASASITMSTVAPAG
jgi:hypothetical protein